MIRAALLAAALLAGTAAHAGVRQQATVLMPDDAEARAFEEKWGFSDAVIVGDTIYLSGIVAGQRPGENSLQPAYERVYRRIGAVLERAGASWDDVVDMTSFHTDVEGQIEDMAAVNKRFLKPPYLAWTAIGVAKVLGGGITEIKIVARRPATARRR